MKIALISLGFVLTTSLGNAAETATLNSPDAHTNPLVKKEIESYQSLLEESKQDKAPVGGALSTYYEQYTKDLQHIPTDIDNAAADRKLYLLHKKREGSSRYY